MTGPVVKLAEIPDNGSVRRVVDMKEVAIFRKGDTVYVIDANCPHRQGPLDEAELRDDFIAVCPWHGWSFDIRDGKSPAQPARVACHKAEVKDGDVYITLS